MTTIAANLECMAADQRCSYESGIYYPATKLFRIGDSIFGCSGHGDMCLVMIEWLKTARNRQILYKQWADYDRDQIELLELSPRGLFKWSGWGLPERINASRWAVGSGTVAAVKGMDRGETPEEAVKNAMNYDHYTGETVQVEWLIPPELKPKRRRG